MIQVNQDQVLYEPERNILKLVPLKYSAPAFSQCLPLCFSVVYFNFNTVMFVVVKALLPLPAMPLL